MASIKQLQMRKYKITVSNGYRPDGRKISRARTITVPGTGAWTGALIAAVLNMRLKRAVPVIFLGVVIAGCIITLLTHGVSMLI